MARSVTTHADRYVSTWIIESPKSDGQGELDQTEERERDAGINVIGNLNIPGRFDCVSRVYGTDGIAPTVTTKGGESSPKIEVSDDD